MHSAMRRTPEYSMPSFKLTRILAVLAVATFSLFAMAGAASAQASPCPPGQPDGRMPGQPPAQPGQPAGRPPQYPPGKCNLHLSQGTAAQGSTVSASGSGYAPNQEVTISFEPGARVLGTAITNELGAFTADVTIPRDAAVGLGTIYARSGVAELSAAIDVTAAGATTGERAREAAPASGGVLSRTGAEIALTALAGLGLVVVGAAAVLGARRFRVTHAA